MSCLATDGRGKKFRCSGNVRNSNGAIGKLGDPSTVAFLEQCAAVPSYRNLIATAAKEAIAAAGARH